MEILLLWRIEFLEMLRVLVDNQNPSDTHYIEKAENLRVA